MSINGTQVLTNFDIFAAAGGKDKAVQETFTATADSQRADRRQLQLRAGGLAADQRHRGAFRRRYAVQAINCGELAGGTITINPGSFTNQGSLQVSNGETS